MALGVSRQASWRQVTQNLVAEAKSNRSHPSGTVSAASNVSRSYLRPDAANPSIAPRKRVIAEHLGRSRTDVDERRKGTRPDCSPAFRSTRLRPRSGVDCFVEAKALQKPVILLHRRARRPPESLH